MTQLLAEKTHADGAVVGLPRLARLTGLPGEVVPPSNCRRHASCEHGQSDKPCMMNSIGDRQDVTHRLLGGLDTDGNGALGTKELSIATIRRLDLDGDLMVSRYELHDAVETVAARAAASGPDGLDTLSPTNRHAATLRTVERASYSAPSTGAREESWAVTTARRGIWKSVIGVALNTLVAVPILAVLGPAVIAGTAGIGATLAFAFGCICGVIAVVGLFVGVAYGISEYCSALSEQNAEIGNEQNEAKLAVDQLAEAAKSQPERTTVPTAAPVSALPALMSASAPGVSIRR